MKLSVLARVDIPRPPEVVFDYTLDCANVPRFLQKKGLIPGVTAASLVDGGGRRRVVMTDGSVLEEEFLALERPSHHRYRWSGSALRPPFGWLVRTGTGDWNLRAGGNGTTFVWTYDFELRSPLAAPAAAVALALFERWMRASLARLREQLA